MGLLSEGSPLTWEETKNLADHVRKHGIIQFLNLYERLRDRENDELKWGDEVEYNLVKLNHKEKKAQLFLKANEILGILQEEENNSPADHPTTWRPEYADYMIEGTPGKPYGHMIAHFNLVEANMKLRREEVLKLLKVKDGETALSLTAYPRLGCPNFTAPEYQPTPTSGASQSLFFPDDAIAKHPRFKTLTRNIRQRRGEKVAINVPIFRDKKTPQPFQEDLTQYGDDGTSQKQSKENHVYADAMGFGMGCSCLQMTFQACNINEGRHLYDQLTPLTPVLLALSAACPIIRGFLLDTDCRWDIISASVDDRTREERSEVPLKNDRYRISKSRYASIDSYLSPCSTKYNDIDLVKDEAIYKQLREAGIDHLLAQHIAHLFIRDPISLFSERVHQNDDCDTDHFENLQSTNWQTMRFKPPPPCSPIGWRVEFRPTEVQLTDFENAAFVVFVVLLTRVILSFNLNFVIPISKVDRNMKRAHKRDAVLNQKFFFRKDVMACVPKSDCEGESEFCEESDTEESDSRCCGRTESMSEDYSCEFTEMTVSEIINGKGSEFPGLIPLIQRYLDSLGDLDVDTSCTIQQYLSLIQKRSDGTLKTTAAWMRSFVHSHPKYAHDSVVSEEINYDLMVECARITSGESVPYDLLPYHDTRSVGDIPVALQKAIHYEAKAKAQRSLSNGGSGSGNGGGANGGNGTEGGVKGANGAEGGAKGGSGSGVV